MVGLIGIYGLHRSTDKRKHVSIIERKHSVILSKF